MQPTLQMTIQNLSNPSLLSIATIVHHKTISQLQIQENIRFSVSTLQMKSPISTRNKTYIHVYAQAIYERSRPWEADHHTHAPAKRQQGKHMAQCASHMNASALNTWLRENYRPTRPIAHPSKLANGGPFSPKIAFSGLDRSLNTHYIRIHKIESQAYGSSHR